jgi:hypothetical protein
VPDQLAAGINLAELSSPMIRQAAEVHSLTPKHNYLHYVRWRQVQIPLGKAEPPHLYSAVEALGELERDPIRDQRRSPGHTGSS